MEELSGYWQGYFIYGLGYDLPFFGEKVKLFAELNFENGLITGYFTEEKGPFSTGRTFPVDGFWQDHLVSLNIDLTDNDVILEDGFTTGNREHEFYLNYSGVFTETKKAIHGNWFMDNESELEIEIPLAQGLWVLRKSAKPKSDFDYSLLGL